MGKSDLAEEIKKLSEQIHNEIVGIRRHLHAHPELSFKEFETAEYVKKQLDEMGIPWKVVADTGILATLSGSMPSDEVIALRADMDALPIQEMNKVSYASRNDKVM